MRQKIPQNYRNYEDWYDAEKIPISRQLWRQALAKWVINQRAFMMGQPDPIPPRSRCGYCKARQKLEVMCDNCGVFPICYPVLGPIGAYKESRSWELAEMIIAWILEDGERRGYL